MWDDYGKPRSGRMPIEVYENSQIVFIQNPIASDAPIGTVVGIISVINAIPPYKLSVGKNPYFSISGNNLISNAALVSGVVYVQIFAVKGFKRIVQAIRIVVGGNSVPSPPQLGFSIGLNMTGVYQGSGNAPLTPTVQNFSYYTNFGVAHFRLLFAWSITQTFPPFFTTGVQHTTFADLDLTYLAVMDQAITNAMAAGGRVLLDCHMFMTGPGGFQVGTVQVPTTALADMWGKIAAHYVNDRPDLMPGIYGMEPMNEPPNGFSSATTLTVFQQVMNALRAAGYTGDVYFDGVNFSSAWNWTSGEGNPFNSSGLSAIVDPLGSTPDRRVFTGHIYPDPDDSGSNFSYASSIAIPGSAPPGINTNPDIFVQRVSREFVPWSQGNDTRIHIGEYGTSMDSPDGGGSYNSASWNLITINGFTYLQANGIPITVWSAGPGFPAGYGGYGYSLDPFNSDLSGAADFSSAGVQAPLIAVIQQFLGYGGAQPTAYAFFSPAFPSLTGARAVAGTPTGNFELYYGGVIPSTVTFTLSVFEADGVTPATGITITPAHPTMAPGVNGLTSFTFSTPNEDRYVVKVTNNAGWVDPPSIFVSSVPDDFSDVPDAQIQGVISLTRLYSLYRGMTVIVLDPVSGDEVTFNFAAGGGTDVPTWQALVGGASSVKTIRAFNQGPGGHTFDWTPLRGYAGASGTNCPSGYGAPSSPTDYPTLMFDYGDGKPAIVFTPPNRMYTNVLLANNTSAGVAGFTDLTLSGRILDAGTLKPFLLWQGLFDGNGPINWGPGGFGIREPASGGTGVVSSTYVDSPGKWQTYGVTVHSNPAATTANGLKMYLNEDLNNEADVPPYSFDPQFAAQSTSVGDSNYEAIDWGGAIRSVRILSAAGSAAASPSKMAQFSATDRANWGDPFVPPAPPAFSFPLVGVNNDGNSLITGILNDYLGNTAPVQNGQVANWSGQFFNVFRMGFNWTNLQPTLQAALDSTAMGFLKAAVDLCIANNIAVLLDMHGNDTGRNPATNSAADYSDFWGRLAAFFSYVTNQDMVMYNVVENEPTGVTQAQLNALLQPTITAIRASGATGYIIMDGLDFTKPQTFVSNGPAVFAALTDPLNKLAYDIHWYFDFGSQGTGTTAIPGSGNALRGASRMARQLGVKLFYGESGIANNAGMQTEAATALQTISDNRDVWLGWAPYFAGTIWPGTQQQSLNPGAPAAPSVAAVMSPHGDARFTQGALNGVLVNWISTCDGGYIPSTITPGTVVATLAPNDENLKGANYTFTKTSDPSSKFTVSGTNLVLAAATVNGVAYGLTLHVADDLGRNASTVVPVVGADAVFLDPNTKSSLVTLSNGNLTATFSAGPHSYVRTTRGVAPGEFKYWETRCVTGAGGFIGWCNQDANLTTDDSILSTSIPNQGSYVGGGYQSNGNMQPTFVPNVGITYAAGDDVCHAMRNITGASLYWGRLNNGNWNGDPTANPATGVGGILVGLIPGTYYPMVGLQGAAQQTTFKLKSSDWTHTPPAGATAIA